jgi:putative ribosome biogenesis GTPase RsgA
MENRNGQRLRRLARVVLALLALEVHPRILVAAACAVAVAAMRIVVVILLRPEALELNNLRNVTAIPKGVLTVVTGVAGSGKSSLIHGCLVPLHPDLPQPLAANEGRFL